MDDFDPITERDDDEPRPRRPRRCSECGCIGSHAQGCPEQEDES